MSQRKKPLAAPPKNLTQAEKNAFGWPIWLAFVWFGGSLFLLPQTLDRYLAPRFLWLAVGLLVGIFFVRKTIAERGDGRLTLLDFGFFGWFGWNLASLGWAFSLSEGLFFAQKTLLAGLVFWFARQMWTSDDERETARRWFQKMTAALSVVSILIGFGQLVLALSKNDFSLANDGLYDLVSGVFGNKGLFADFLFFLLIFNVFTIKQYKNRLFFWSIVVALVSMILILQTRTVYLATGLFAAIYFGFRAWTEPDFRPIFRRKIAPIGLVAAIGLAFFVVKKGQNLSLAERLNPMTYLESASATERRFVWYKTGKMIDDAWLAGVGDGSWKLIFPSKGISGGHRLMDKGIVFTRAHNDFLEIWAELGLVGLAIFVSICLCGLLAGGFRIPDFGFRNRKTRLALGLLAVWTAGFSFFSGEQKFEWRLTWLFGLFLLAALVGLYFLKDEKDENARHDILVATLGLLGFCLISNFDFPRERLEMQVVFGFLMSILAWRTGSFWSKTPHFEFKKGQNLLFGLMSIGLVFSIFLGWKRVEAEAANVRTAKAQMRGDFQTMAREAVAAQNFFYQYNDVVLPMAWFEGLALYQKKDLEGADQAFSRAMELNPWSFQVLNNRASILVAKNRLAEAMPFFEKSLEINPRYDESRFNFSLALFQSGEFQKAFEVVNLVDTTEAENRRKWGIWMQQILPKIGRDSIVTH